MTDLLLIPLDDVVVFPNMTATLSVDVGEESEVLLVPRHEGTYASVGTVASVGDRVRLPGGGRAVTLEGLYRASIGAARTDTDGRLRAEVEARPDEPVPPIKTVSSRANIARSSRRSSSFEATTAGSRASCARSPSRARSPIPVPTHRSSHTRTACACSRRSTSSGGSSSQSRSSASA